MGEGLGEGYHNNHNIPKENNTWDTILKNTEKIFRNKNFHFFYSHFTLKQTIDFYLYLLKYDFP